MADSWKAAHTQDGKYLFWQSDAGLADLQVHAINGNPDEQAAYDALFDIVHDASHEDRCYDGDCVNAEAVVQALIDSGFPDVDGDGDGPTIIADHVRHLASERDELRAALAEACDAFVECTGGYAQQLAARDLDRWRGLANPLLAEADGG